MPSATRPRTTPTTRMHDLKVERFYKPQMINGLVATKQGPIKTFPLRGIKESPPYFHDGRLLTLEDTVEFFNLILETKLTEEEKKAARGVHAGAVVQNSPQSHSRPSRPTTANRLLSCRVDLGQGAAGLWQLASMVD